MTVHAIIEITVEEGRRTGDESRGITDVMHSLSSLLPLTALKEWVGGRLKTATRVARLFNAMALG
jgi:hypothetical protein